MTTARSWWQALPLWLLSGLGAGLGNQLPQQWLATHAPSHKSQLLAAALLAGALASLLGVWMVADRALSPILMRWILPAGLVLAALLTLVLPQIEQLWAFAAVFLVLRAGLNALTQLLDRQLIAAGPRPAGNLANTSWRLIGMSTGSLGFAYALSHGAWVAAAVLSLLALSLAAVGPAPVAAVVEIRPTGLPLLAADRWLLAAGWAAYATLYLFAADLSYLLGDFLHLDRPAERAGQLLLLVYAASVVGAGLSAWWQRWRGPLGGLAFVVAGGLIGGGAACGLLPFAASPWLLAGLSIAMGLAHALFLSAARTWLTAAAAAGRSSLIGGFNNLPNWGAVGGFAGLGLIAWISSTGDPAFHPRVLGLIGLLAAVSALCGWQVGRLASGGDRV